MKKINHYRRGKWAEYYAALYLFIKGYGILKMRYKTKVGEVDIVARRGKTICFVEVKYRENYSDAVDSISAKSQSRIRRAGQHYLFEHDRESNNVDYQLRCDAIIITKNLFIRHIENAF